MFFVISFLWLIVGSIPYVGVDACIDPRVRLAAKIMAASQQKLARSCGSKPHWGFDRYATPQCKHPPLQRGCNPFKVIAAQHIYYSTTGMHLSILNMHK